MGFDSEILGFLLLGRILEMGACCSKEVTYGGLPEREEEVFEDCEEETRVGDGGARVRLNTSSNLASMHTVKGRKGVNQDSMTLWEDFNGEKETIFCSVFDGHGPLGHKVACFVRDNLPSELSQELKLLRPRYSNINCRDDDGDDDNSDAYNIDINDDDDKDSDNSQNNEDASPSSFSSWKAGFVKAFKNIDEQLNTSKIECYFSGSTAVSILKQGEHLTISNLGDSRAVLCTRDINNQPIPVQLTVDLKPNVPCEAERVMRCGGRIFALGQEPSVYRIWLPDEEFPGLAMSRAFGDFCLKDYGVITIPRVSYRKITDRDEFVVIATDGVWDVLSNRRVVKIIASSQKRSMAAKLLTESAACAWRNRSKKSRIDDITAICLFFKPVSSFTNTEQDTQENDLEQPPSPSSTATTIIFE